MWDPCSTTVSRGKTAANISKAPHFPHSCPPNKRLIGTSKSPEALRRGGGVPGVMTHNTLLPPTAASVTMRGIPKGDPSPLGGVLLELFCRRGQKSGKVCAVGYEMRKTFFKKFSPPYLFFKVFERGLGKTFSRKVFPYVLFCSKFSPPHLLNFQIPDGLKSTLRTGWRLFRRPEEHLTSNCAKRARDRLFKRHLTIMRIR